MNIGERIRLLREDRGISARRLAKEINIDPSHISKIENNDSNPSIDTLQKICNVLGITLSQFFDVDNFVVDPHLGLLEFSDILKKLPAEEKEALLRYLKVRLKNEK